MRAAGRGAGAWKLALPAKARWQWGCGPIRVAAGRLFQYLILFLFAPADGEFGGHFDWSMRFDENRYSLCRIVSLALRLLRFE